MILYLCRQRSINNGKRPSHVWTDGRLAKKCELLTGKSCFVMQENASVPYADIHNILTVCMFVMFVLHKNVRLSVLVQNTGNITMLSDHDHSTVDWIKMSSCPYWIKIRSLSAVPALCNRLVIFLILALW